MALILTDQSGNQYSLSVNSADGSLSVQAVQNATPSTNDNSIWQNPLQLITKALRTIGVVAGGELPSSDEAADSLGALNEMLDSWNADRLNVFSVQYADYPFTVGTQAYTLGPGGGFNANRPAKIVGMSAILLNNPTNPVEVPMAMYTDQDWQTKIPVKNVSSSFPQVCYDDGNFPLRTLNFWPIPSQANSVRIYSWQALGATSLLTSVLNLPPGYAEALRYNLAVRLAIEFEKPVSPDIRAMAIESLGRVKTMNAPELELKSDLVPDNGGYNYKADLFGIPF